MMITCFLIVHPLKASTKKPSAKGTKAKSVEKVSVEQGFISFLNTLRHPIQIYIQTRTINLERSVQGNFYKSPYRKN